MIPDNIIYTDGHDVTITDAKFKVKNNSYKLNGITKHGMYVLRPRKAPGIIMVAVGVILALVGFFALIPSATMPAVQTGDSYVSANTVFFWIGVGLTILGILALTLVRKRYAVRIDTAEGERNVLVSTNRAYITQVVDALNEAIYKQATAFHEPEPVRHHEVIEEEHKHHHHHH